MFLHSSALMERPTFASFRGLKKMCALCDEEVPVIGLQAHTARCLIAIGIEFGNEPYCTCPSCQGFGSHTGPSRLPSLERRTPERVEPEVDFDDVFDDISPPPPQTATTMFLGSQMTGKRCFFCKSTTQPPKHHPLMRVGRYYGARFCCGQHFSPGPDREALKAALKQFSLHELINRPPDAGSSLVLFDEESPNRPLTNEEMGICGGDGTGAFCPNAPSTDQRCTSGIPKRSVSIASVLLTICGLTLATSA